MIIKQYGPATGAGDERRYSPVECTGIKKEPIIGNPDQGKISTSYGECQNPPCGWAFAASHD